MEVADLFCGAGGFSAGFKMANLDIVFGLDFDKNACKTFQHNFKDAEVVCKDIKDFDDWPDVDIIIGSPPCIDFSKGNVNRGFDMSLVDHFLKIIEKLSPKYWVMENVPDMAKTMIFTCNYAPRFPNIQIMIASDYGAATVRRRFFGGKFPKVYNPRINRCVRDVINIDRPGHQQPYKDHVYRRINPDEPLFTICAQRISNDRYLLPNGSSLSIPEYAVCQGFPSWFVFPVSRSQAQQQIGNSVSPLVAKAIAEAIKKDYDSSI